MNVIGLKNHRPFIVMMIGLAIVITGSILMDLALMVAIAVAFHDQEHLLRFLILICHFGTYIVFGRYTLPVFKMHMGFITRNELAKEWVDNKYQVWNGRQVVSKSAVNMFMCTVRFGHFHLEVESHT